MKCPQCKGYSLEPKELEPGLVAGACDKCDGTLISLMNYRYWADQLIPSDSGREPQVSDQVLLGENEIKEVEDTSQAQVCPKCSKLMTKFQIGLMTSNRIDMCNNCDEAWLDKGEWKLLKQLDLAEKLPKIFTEAWQRNIRLQRQAILQKERYSALLGEEDFEKLEEFKQWLVKHPEREQMKQYLITYSSNSDLCNS